MIFQNTKHYFVCFHSVNIAYKMLLFSKKGVSIHFYDQLKYFTITRGNDSLRVTKLSLQILASLPLSGAAFEQITIRQRSKEYLEIVKLNDNYMISHGNRILEESIAIPADVMILIADKYVDIMRLVEDEKSNSKPHHKNMKMQEGKRSKAVEYEKIKPIRLRKKRRVDLKEIEEDVGQ